MKLFMLIIFLSGYIGAAPMSGYTACSDYKESTDRCSENFSGLQLQLCEVCREEKSCSWTFSNNKYRGYCRAYLEGESCLMSLNDGGSDRDWCEVLKEGGDCSVLQSSVQEKNCLEGYYPRDHLFWIN